MDLELIAPLFAGWEETMLLSCLQGYMGTAAADNEDAPRSARITVGDFCFFAGIAQAHLVQTAEPPILVPQNEAWAALIEQVWGSRVQKKLRYATKKEPDVFALDKLQSFTKLPSADYALQLFTPDICKEAMQETWSKDFCSNFYSAEDYLHRGLGAAVLYRGKLVSGASSYTVYQGGLEIEIGTKPAFRRKGLALACGAKLILESLERGLYPSWDAHDLRSLHLAEKLGYQLEKPYRVYLKKE